MTPFEKRIAAVAESDPVTFGRAVAQRYGHTPANVAKLLDLGVKLSQPTGGRISDADIKMLKQIHPHANARVIEEVAREINDQPARLRGQYFTAAVTMDLNVAQDNLSNASAAYHEVADLIREHETQGYVDAINARRGGVADASPAWRPEPGSVRDHLERAFETPGAREFADAMGRGDPQADYVGRHMVADAIDRSADKLQDDSLGLRDHLSAAYDMHTSEALAVEHFGEEVAE